MPAGAHQLGSGWPGFYLRMLIAAGDHEHADAEGHHRFDHDQQFGPPLDRGDVGWELNAVAVQKASDR